MVWAKKGGEANLRLNAVTPRLSLIAALDTDGKVWFCLGHSTTSSDVMAVFLQHLVKALDSESPGWQEDTVLLWDNATYHSSAETMRVVRRLGL